MIHEYAVDPELVSTWTDRRDCRFCLDSFGMDKGRLICRFPKNWKKKIWEKFSDRANSIDLSEKERAVMQMRKSRLMTLLQQFDQFMIRRPSCQWDPGLQWMENACRENDRLPFFAILTQKPITKPSNVVSFEDIFELHHSLWDIETSRRIPRKPFEMAKAVSTLLGRSYKIHFIDPHFGPDKKRYKTSFLAFFQEIIRDRSKTGDIKIDIHLSDESENQFFVDSCNQHLPFILPEGCDVTLRRWSQKDGGEKLHDRFILTEIGGVKFSVGLDEGKEGETTDVSLMKKPEYQQIWSQYAGTVPAFKRKFEPIIVSGGRKLPSDKISG